MKATAGETLNWFFQGWLDIASCLACKPIKETYTPRLWMERLRFVLNTIKSAADAKSGGNQHNCAASWEFTEFRRTRPVNCILVTAEQVRLACKHSARSWAQREMNALAIDTRGLTQTRGMRGIPGRYAIKRLRLTIGRLKCALSHSIWEGDRNHNNNHNARMFAFTAFICPAIRPEWGDGRASEDEKGSQCFIVKRESTKRESRNPRKGTERTTNIAWRQGEIYFCLRLTMIVISKNLQPSMTNENLKEIRRWKRTELVKSFFITSTGNVSHGSLSQRAAARSNFPN